MSIFVTGISRHIGSDLSAEIRDNERRRNESYGDRGDCKSPRRADPRLVARTFVFSQEILIARQRIPMRRRDLGWLAVLTDPFTRLSRPASDIIGPARIILKDDSCSV